jgi:hypothetical protein
MNGSTTRGEAWGFKLDSLIKMLDVKSSVDSKVSLLHFVAQEMERFNPDYADLIQDFPHLEAAVRESLPMIQGDLGRLKGGLNQVKNLPANPQLDEKYKNAFSKFVPNAEEVLTKASGDLETLQKKYKELVAFFGEDPKIEAEEFFALLNNFVQAYDKARKDNARRKALAEKAKEAETKKAVKRVPGAKPENANVLENMLSELVTGEAFSQRAANMRKQQRDSLAIKKPDPPPEKSAIDIAREKRAAEAAEAAANVDEAKPGFVDFKANLRKVSPRKPEDDKSPRKGMQLINEIISYVRVLHLTGLTSDSDTGSGKKKRPEAGDRSDSSAPTTPRRIKADAAPPVRSSENKSNGVHREKKRKPKSGSHPASPRGGEPASGSPARSPHSDSSVPKSPPSTNDEAKEDLAGDAAPQKKKKQGFFAKVFGLGKKKQKKAKGDKPKKVKE